MAHWGVVASKKKILHHFFTKLQYSKILNVYRTYTYLTQSLINVTQVLNVPNTTSKIRIVAMFVNLDWQPIILTFCMRVFAVYHRAEFHLPNSNVSLVITIEQYIKKENDRKADLGMRIYEVRQRSAHAQNRDVKAHTCRKAEGSS